MRKRHYMAMSEFESWTIKTEKGPVRTRPHYATFNEKHNASRVKVYLTLYQLSLMDIKRGLTTGEISGLSGVDSAYINNKMAKWVKWGFCEKSTPVSIHGRISNTYVLADRGLWFITEIVPHEWLEYYAAEIKQHRESKKSPALFDNVQILKYEVG